MSFADHIPIDALKGLRPRSAVCVGAGFAREELKAALLAAGHGFVADAVLNPQEICLRVLAAAMRGLGRARVSPQVSVERILGGLARQEVLRLLLAEPRISAKMPELKRLRRQGTFFKKLDRSVQAGRAAFAHEDEHQVYLERLRERVGDNPLRAELELLSRAYDAWLSAKELWDPPLLMRHATEVLREGRPESLILPDKMHLFSAQTAESLERDFWEVLGSHVEVVRVGPLEAPSTQKPGPATWERWHTLDDAAEALAESLLAAGPESWRTTAILMPDLPAVRRTLRRALEARGVPLADPRDPTRLRWDEGLKWALLPLEVVARGFERDEVISWLRTHLGADQPELPEWVKEINSRGLRTGLRGFQGGKLAAVQARLSELQSALGGRKLCTELAEAHLALLRAALGSGGARGSDETARQLNWVVPFFEATWTSFVEDMERVGQAERRAPALFWLERLQARLEESTPPVEKLKPEGGVQLFRLNQAPLLDSEDLWLFGVPPGWLSGDGAGDYWFSERDREVLCAEFAVRSGISVRAERIAVLKAWLAGAARLHVLDAEYDWDGRERQTLFPVLRDLGLADVACVDLGSHARWLPSHGTLRPLPPQQLQLPSLAERGVTEIRATDVDLYSRCSFQALSGRRWRLRDIPEPDGELWPDARGNILHKALRALVESRDAEGNFARDPGEALEEAWKSEGPRGLIRSPRLERYNKARLLLVLLAFCEKEREYVKRAGTTVAALEGPALRIECGHGAQRFAIVGTPDRVDQNPEGVFVLDYKSTSALPKGRDMLELGYGLQLPFYALGAAAAFGKPALGVQFVELNRKASRTSGLFFARYNGKDPGKLTATTKNSKSLVDVDPVNAWIDLEEHVQAHAQGYYDGKFAAHPKKSSDCAACWHSDLCGHRRLSGKTAETPQE